MEGTGAEWRPSIGQSEPKGWQQHAHGAARRSMLDLIATVLMFSSSFQVKKILAAEKRRSIPLGNASDGCREPALRREGNRLWCGAAR